MKRFIAAFILILLLGIITSVIFRQAILKQTTAQPAALLKSASLPGGFPVYPGASAPQSNLTNARKPTFIWQSQGEVTQVIDWYETTLKKAGWSITIPPTNTNPYKDTVQNLEARQGSNKILQLAVVKDAAGLKITAEFPDPSLFEEEEEK